MGGFALDRVKDPAAKRLSQFLMFVGVAGVGAAVGFAVQEFASNTLSPPMAVSAASQKAAEWAWFAAAVAIAASGGLVWWRHKTWLQHLAFGVGVAASSLLVLPLIPIEGPEWGAGAVLVAVSAVWGALALQDWIPPRIEGLALATLGIVGGFELMVLPVEVVPQWALWLGALACIALVVAGSTMKEYVVIGIAAFGLAAFSAQIVGEYLGFGMVTSIALIVIGFALLGNAVRLMLTTQAASTQTRAVLAEATGYAGVAFALGGAGVLLGEFFDELGIAGRIGVPLVGAVVAYACALLVERAQSGSAHRLSQVLLAIGAITAAVTVAMVARPFADSAGEQADAELWTALAGSAAAVVSGGVTWWFRKGSPTQLVLVGAIVMTVVTAMGIAEPEGVPFWVPALALTVIGSTWVALGVAKLIMPSNTAVAAGSLVALMGLQMMQRTEQGSPVVWAAWLGVGLAVLAIVASVLLRRGVLLGFGAFGLVVMSMQAIMVHFQGRIAAPFLLLIMGVVFIVVAVMVAVLMPRMRRGASERPHRPPSTPMPTG